VQAAYDLYKSGRVAPAQGGGFCALLLRRSHMRELSATYETTLSN
jgi:hypothetical protein